MYKAKLAVIGLALAAIPASAAAPDAAAPAWMVQHDASELGFAGYANGQPFQGEFEGWNAEIHFDPDDLEHSMAEVTVDMKSAFTGDQAKDQYLPEPDFFSVALFPQAIFKTSSITSTGGNAYEAQGVLTIRDISQDVTLPFTLDIDGDTATMNGELTFDRTTFGVGQGSWEDSSSIGLEVTVEVELVAKRAG